MPTVCCVKPFSRRPRLTGSVQWMALDILEFGSSKHSIEDFQQFDVLLDCALFHSLSDEKRATFTRAANALCCAGACYFVP